MKVRLAILDDDKGYLDRMVSIFSTKYADNLQIYAYTDCQEALDSLDKTRVHVFLVSSEFEIEPKTLPERCALAYFVDMAGIATYKGSPAICKFQKLDQIYKQILSLYAEYSDAEASGRAGSGKAKITLYMSPAGGVGTSTVAAANARYYANLGRKTLFLTVDPFDSVEKYFRSVGNFSFRHAIRAVKSKKINLALKLESYVQQDPCGVYFYSSAPLALDVMELNGEDLSTIFQELLAGSNYQHIVVDVPFGLDKDRLDLCKLAGNLVLVTDGSASANAKLMRTYESVEMLERSGMATLSGQTYLVYNRFSDMTAKVIDETDWHNAGAIPCYTDLSGEQLGEKIARAGVFDKIL